jgi:chaperonin GroES
MNIRPLYDRIVVRRVKEEEKTAGGLYIPDTAKEKPQEAKVVAVGEGKRGDDGKIHKLVVKKGDRILLSKYAGSEITVDGVECIIMREDDILGILE